MHMDVFGLMPGSTYLMPGVPGRSSLSSFGRLKHLASNALQKRGGGFKGFR